MVAACGGDLSLPNEGQVSDLQVAGGNNQNGTIGQPLLDSLAVRVTDRFGDPVAGVTVTWSAETGGSVNPTTTVTGADGYARAERVLRPDVGTYVTRAEVTGIEDPHCAAHGPNESLHLAEFARTCLAEALFLRTIGS